jgi:glycosyltransferase involved in cell wall biosynthesis
MAKKILFIITKANWGGAQRYVYDLACASQEAGYEALVAYGEPGLLATKLADSGVRAVHIGSLGRDIKGGRDWQAFKELRALIAREKPNIVNVNSSKAAGLGALAARLAHVPRVIYTSHGWAFNEARPLWQRLILRMAAEATIYLAHETICVSQAIKRDISPIAFAGHKLTVIRNGIACGELMARADARAALLPHHADKRWVGMVSELHPTKRVQDAIEAFGLLGEMHPDTILVVLGEGEERAKLEDVLAKHGLADRVFLLGFVADAPHYLSAFDIFLHTSLSEALAYAILEAGCASLPVVATRVGGIPEMVEGDVSGILVPPRSPATVAAALDTLLKDPARAIQLGAALRTKVRTAFSQSRMITETFAVYTK